MHLAAPHYVLGETETHHSDIPGFERRARAQGMALLPDLWGWGTVRRTARSLDELVVDVGKRVVGDSGVDEVDLVLLCSSAFPGDAWTHGGFVETVMAGLGLDCAFLGLTLHRCTGLLEGMSVAETFIRAGRHRSILLVTADRITDESTRQESFALFTDGAAGCLVTASEGEFAVLGSASAHDTRRLSWEHEISVDLARRVNDDLLTRHGLTSADLAGVMHTNIVLPLVVTKEIQAGFTREQLDTTNIARVGHCFAADPLINLVDRPTERDAHYLLAASVPGSRAAVLLRRTARGGDR